MSKIAHIQTSALRLKKSGVRARLWPNGEISFWTPKKMKEPPLPAGGRSDGDTLADCLVRAYGLAQALKYVRVLGLSNVTNFDRPKKSQVRSGLKGMTSLGKRRVRNACYMLTREAGQFRLTFSTVTLPPLCEEDYLSVHLNWHKVMDAYRREMGRQLRRGGLTGEIVGVTEVQPDRWKDEGIPWLHGHFVFVGMARSGGWVVSPAKHDSIWRRAIQTVVYGPLPSFKSACRLESVRKSADGYLSKYMSKGGPMLDAIASDGFEWALPRQWWGMTRSLVQRMAGQVQTFTEGVPWLLSLARAKDSSVWLYFNLVEVEIRDGPPVCMGAVGMLTPAFNGWLHQKHREWIQDSPQDCLGAV